MVQQGVSVTTAARQTSRGPGLDWQEQRPTFSRVAAAKPAGPAPITMTRPAGFGGAAAAAARLAAAAATAAALFAAALSASAAALVGSAWPS